jgi:hypothetical protein
MAATYNDILRQLSHRLNALSAPTYSTANSNYGTSPLTTTQYDAPQWPFEALKDAILFAQLRIIRTVADTKNNPWRQLYQVSSGSLASGATIPTTISSAEVLGARGAVKDASDSRVLRPRSPEVIAEIVANTASTWASAAYYFYAYEGERIYHTRTNVTVDLCAFNHTAEKTAIATLGNAVKVPDGLVPELLDASIAHLAGTEGASLMPAANFYGTLAAASLSLLRSGATEWRPGTASDPEAKP